MSFGRIKGKMGGHKHEHLWSLNIVCCFPHTFFFFFLFLSSTVYMAINVNIKLHFYGDVGRNLDKTPPNNIKLRMNKGEEMQTLKNNMSKLIQ